MTRTLVTAIVSTAAPGAERGALDAAIELDIGYGGRTALPITPETMPAIYVARCVPVRNRDLAVRLNVQDSDGTLIVSFADALTGRCKHAADQCKAQRKPCQHLILQAGARSRITEAVRTGLLRWIDERHVSVLHVVGPGEEQEPGIQQAVRDALVWVLEDDVVVPTPLRIGDPVDAPGWQTTIDANMAEVDKHQVHGAQVPDDFGPATRADLDDLDAVPEPVDSDAPPSTYLPGAAPIGPTAQTRPYRRKRHITGPDGVPRPESEDPERLAARVKARPQDVVDWIVDRSKALIERSKHAAHCPAKCSPAKPTLPEVRPLIDAYYALPGNGAGGELHVVLDDGNYERSCIEWCIKNAQREETKVLGAVLMLMSNSQRRRM